MDLVIKQLLASIREVDQDFLGVLEGLERGKSMSGRDMQMRTKRKKKKPAFRRKRNENRLGMFMIAIAMVMVFVVVSINGMSLREKQQALMAKEATLQAQIQEQQQRTTELEEFATYTKTKKYAEEVAKEKLGLVYENEIIFKQED